MTLSSADLPSLAGHRILVTGGSGLVGSYLIPALLKAGAEVVATSRRPAEYQWPGGVETLTWSGEKVPAPPGKFTMVVNLAGASIGGQRWSQAYKLKIRRSRVRMTRNLASWIASKPPSARPVLINASAIGYYGIDPEGPCSEDRPPGDDFLAEVCQAWEAAAMSAPTRVVRLRCGHILAADGGLLGRLLPIYGWRLGGRMGSGKQGLPWIHVDDLVRVIIAALTDPGFEGAYNVAAPQTVNQRQFNDALGKQLQVFAGWFIPGFALRIGIGELANYILKGQETPPNRLLEAGWEFSYPSLELALADLFD